MADNLIYIDAKGDKQPVDLHVGMYREAAEKGQSLKQFMANKYPTNAEKHGSAYEQVADVADKTKSLTKDLLDYVKELSRDRGGIASPAEKLQKAREEYGADLKLAQAGDVDALGRITKSAQTYVEAQKDYTASSAVTQDVIDQVLADLQGVTSNVPHFAAGGYHAGGWAMVGEEGPELAYFGSQARIYTAQQSTSMLSNDAVVAELRALREEVVQLRAQQTEETRAVINSNAAVQGRAAEAIVNGVAAAGERQAWNQASQPVIA